MHPHRRGRPARRRASAGAVEPELAPRPGRLSSASLALAVVWALLFAPQLAGGRIFVVGDASYLRAFAEFSAEQWEQHHERTHWNPYIFAGLPATASLQDSRPQWLPDPLLEAFDRLHRLPGFPPLAIPLLVHLAGMIAMAALSRELWGARTVTMIWAGIAWGLLPSLLVPLAFGQDSLFMSACLMPVVLLAVERSSAATAPRARAAAALGLSLAAACALLAAHPQIETLTAPLALAFAIARARARRRWTSLLDVTLAAAIGMAAAAAVWWPALLYNAQSTRGGAGIALSEVERWSAGLPDLLSLFWPWAAGFGGATYWGGLRATDFPQYAGLVACALAVWGLGRRDANGATAVTLFMAAVVSLVLALGSNAGVVFQVLRHVPLWSSFRVAIRALILAHLAVALLSARGLERLWEASRATPRGTRWMLLGAAGLGLVVAALLAWGFLGSAYADAVRAARPALSAALVGETLRHAALDLGWRSILLAASWAAITAASRAESLGSPRHAAWSRIAAGSALVALALDLGGVSWPFLKQASGPPDGLEHPAIPTMARIAAADHTARVLDASRARLFSNDWIRWRARSLTGNHPAVPRVWDEFGPRGLFLSEAVLRALAIRYVGGLPVRDTTRFEQVGAESSGSPVWRFEGALPRAYTTERVTGLADEEEVLSAMAASGFDARAEVYTADKDAAGYYPGSGGAQVRWIEDEPDRLVLETSADSVAFLVIADTWFPGWRASLDGKRWPIHRVLHAVRGLVIPAGRHRLLLTYEPEGWREGVATARGAWTLWLLGLVVLTATRRGRRSG